MKKYIRIWLDKELDAEKIEQWKRDGIVFKEGRWLVCFYRISPEWLTSQKSRKG